MIEPKDIEIELAAGGVKRFVISKFDAISGRKILTQYPTSGVPKLGDYDTNEGLMLQIMSFVSVPMPEGLPLPLTTRELVSNHVPEWETVARLEWAMIEYNCSFFRNGKVSTFLDDLMAKLPASILSISTDLLEQLSQKDKPASENSKPSTH